MAKPTVRRKGGAQSDTLTVYATRADEVHPAAAAAGEFTHATSGPGNASTSTSAARARNSNNDGLNTPQKMKLAAAVTDLHGLDATNPGSSDSDSDSDSDSNSPSVSNLSSDKSSRGTGKSNNSNTTNSGSKLQRTSTTTTTNKKKKANAPEHHPNHSANGKGAQPSDSDESSTSNAVQRRSTRKRNAPVRLQMVAASGGGGTAYASTREILAHTMLLDDINEDDEDDEEHDSDDGDDDDDDDNKQSDEHSLTDDDNDNDDDNDDNEHEQEQDDHDHDHAHDVATTGAPSKVAHGGSTGTAGDEELSDIANNDDDWRPVKRSLTQSQLNGMVDYFNARSRGHRCPCGKRVKDLSILFWHMVTECPNGVFNPKTVLKYAKKINKTLKMCSCGKVCERQNRGACKGHKLRKMTESMAHQALATATPPATKQRQRHSSQSSSSATGGSSVIRRPAKKRVGKRRKGRARGLQTLRADARDPDSVLADKYEFFTVENVVASRARNKLDEVAVYFAPDTASAHPRREDNCCDLWLRVMKEVVAATAESVRTRQLQPDKRALLQKMGVTVLISLPGLALHYAKDKSSPLSAMVMRQVLAHADMKQQIKKFSLSAVILDYFILPLVRDNARETPDDDAERGLEKPPARATLTALIRDGYFSKSMSLARRKFDMEHPEPNSTTRRQKPTIAKIKAVAADKFPASDKDMDALPAISQMPAMDAEGGTIHWSSDADTRTAQKKTFGATSVVIERRDLDIGLRFLKRQAAPGVGAVSSAFLRQCFCNGGESDQAINDCLLPFVNICLSGNMHVHALETLLLTRLALLPKADDDFRPLGIGGAIYRLIEVTLNKKYESAVSKKLRPNQFSVGVRDSGAILPALAQAMFNEGRKRLHDNCDLLFIDMKNAYNSIRRKCVLEGLRKYAPHLVRWFLYTHTTTTKLVHSSTAHVGECQTGVKQGDPLASLYFAVGLHDTLVEIHKKVKAQYSDAAEAARVGAFAFGDDVFLVGNLVKSIELLPMIRHELAEKTGLQLVTGKCVAITSRARPDDDELFEVLQQHRVTVQRDGGVMMGVPFGTDDFIDNHVGNLIDNYIKNLHALQFFDRQAAFTLLRMCINAKPPFLARCLPLHRADEHFKKFDEQVTQQILTIAGVPRQQRSPELVDHVHNLRGLPGFLSGTEVHHINRKDVRSVAVLKARVSTLRFFVDDLPSFADPVKELWADDFEVTSIVATSSYNPDASEDKLQEQLRGHTLGNISTFSTITLPGTPSDVQPTTNGGGYAMDRAAKAELDDHVYDANLVLHTRILENLRNSDNQYQTPIAAQILSQSCPNSGRMLKNWPIYRNRLKDPLFVHGLRCQLGIPFVLPVPGDISCHCGNVLQSVDLSSTEAIDEDGQVTNLQPHKLTEEPLHPLYCRRVGRAGLRQIRHDKIAKLLGRKVVKLFHGAQISFEPMVNRGSDKRGDILITTGGKQIILDVMVTCPAAPSMVQTHNSHRIPGAAAVRAVKIKNRKYGRSVPEHTEFVPFVIETGGRLAKTTCVWLDSFWKNVSDPKLRKQRQASVRGICVDLQRQLFVSNANMLSKFSACLTTMSTDQPTY